MITERFAKNRLVKTVFGCLFAIMSLFSLATVPTGVVYAEEVQPVHAVIETQEENPEETEETTEKKEVTEEAEKEEKRESGITCNSSLGSGGWLICNAINIVSEATDWMYNKIEDILIINPVQIKDDEPVYELWKHFLGFANIVFMIFLLVVVYSQLTGLGISNYGIKKALPKLIVAAIVVNLSFLICSVAVDLSNIIGASLRGVFTSVEDAVASTIDIDFESALSMSAIYATLAGTLAIGAIGVSLGFDKGIFWMVIPVALGAVVAVVSGLVTIALRQAVVTLLIIISPLAFVAYILPNTGNLFEKWKKLFTKMLVFYPMFSLLFGASNLAGWAIMASAKGADGTYDAFTVLLGKAVQIFPLFFSWSMMKMSGTFLGTINARMRGLAARPLAANRAWADSHRQATKQKFLASSKAYTPTMRLNQFLFNRSVEREEETKEHMATARNQALSIAANKNYKKDGTPSKKGLEAYEMQARNMKYQADIERHKNNMNEGLGQLAAVKNSKDFKMRAKLDELDVKNVKAADILAAEKVRGEKIEYDNALGRWNRMNDAMDAHMDAMNGYDTTGERLKTYKLHFDDEKKRKEAMERYNEMNNIAEGDPLLTQYIVANAAKSYDSSRKIFEGKMQSYFDQTVPTKDIEYRLNELTKNKATAFKNIDAIVSGLRVLNQRGDTDLVKAQLDHVLDHGLKVGTHASQALANFLMFDVKDSDPFLRRFGKYINLETARVYNKNERRKEEITYEEYINGYHEEENGRMYAKKGMVELMEGTSLDNIERTTFGNLDESLKKAYTKDNGELDVDGYINKKKAIMKAIKPAFFSAAQKWASGSEQINSAVKFWMGYESKQDEFSGEYVKQPVWENDKDFKGHENDIEGFYNDRTKDFINDQTAAQILGMRSDFYDALARYLEGEYIEKKDDRFKELVKDRGWEADYNAKKKAVGEIAAKKYFIDRAKGKDEEYYKDKFNVLIRDKGWESDYIAKKKAVGEIAAKKYFINKMKDEDGKYYRKHIIGEPYRDILKGTGKLVQLYRTQRSGGGNAAKDWNRQMIGLDDEEIMKEEIKNNAQDINSYDSDWAEKFIDMNKRAQAEDIEQELDLIWDNGNGQNMNKNEFYNKILKLLNKTLNPVGGTCKIMDDMSRYWSQNNKSATPYDLYSKAKQLIRDENNF